MQEANANRNPEWDAVLGDDTMTGTARLLGLIMFFIIIGGSVFHFII
jgi:hypothetical protein